MQFRDLRADEIDVRVSTVSAKGCSLLLYKDARCDMNILDETVGAENWQRRHTRDNANCVVSIWCESKKQWIEKEDTGTESYTEKEKGLASDSFKRACFNWGVGRELYTAPFIWVSSNYCNIEQKNNKWTTYDRFYVSNIRIEDKQIVSLEIVNEKTGKVCFRWSKANARPSSAVQKPQSESCKISDASKKALNTAIGALEKLTGETTQSILGSLYKLTGKKPSEYTEDDAKKALAQLSQWQKHYTERLGA